MSDAFPPTVVVSLDLELSWGTFDVEHRERVRARARWTHDVGVPLLLSMLSRNGLTATWAVVGGMMRDRLPSVDHFEEVSYPHFKRPWFSSISRTATERDAPEWFGASVVKLIQEAKPTQEVAFHSFSHVVFGHRGTPRGRAQQELEACRTLAYELGIDGTSFVFPRNSVAFLDLLAENGFRAFRSPDQLPFVPFPTGRSLAGVLADVVALPPRLVKPQLKGGLVEIAGSLMVRYAGGWRKFIPDFCRTRRLLSGLDSAIRRGGVFHVWFHPENLYEERPRMEKVLDAFFSRLGREVAAKRVRCLTMGTLATEVLSAQAAGFSSRSQ